MNTRILGELGEKIAEAFLAVKGYNTVRKNYRYARREIDLLVRKDDYLVAVEVKLRRGDRFGVAVEAVDEKKLIRLRVALEGYLQSLPRHIKPRIDLVVIDLSKNMHEMSVRHIEGIY